MSPEKIPAVMQPNTEHERLEGNEDITLYRKALEASLDRIGRDENKSLNLRELMGELAERLLDIEVEGVPEEIQQVYRLSQFLDDRNKNGTQADKNLVMAARATLNEQMSLLTVEERESLERVETDRRLVEAGYAQTVAIAA
jgi:hypothetical protein